MSPEQQLAEITLRVLEAQGDAIAEDVRTEISAAYPPPSDPGTPPHRRTGQLAKSISHLVRQEGSKTYLEVVAEAPHAEWLEHGTSRMAARPFLAPMQDKHTPEIASSLESAVNK